MSSQLAQIKQQAIAARQKSKPIESLIQASLKELGKALPAHLNAERLVRIALTTLRLNPKLSECTPESFLGALFQSAQLGLEPNVEGQAYITSYLNNKKIVDEAGKIKWIKVLEAQFQIGYKGYIELFYRHKAAEFIDTHAVYENDIFEYQYGTNSFLKHCPVFKNRGNVIAYYAVAKIKDGGSIFKIMSKDACFQHAKTHSKCYDNDSQSFDKNSPWSKFPDAMCKKTVIIQLSKLLPKSVELQKALAMDNTTKSKLDIDMFNIKDETNWIDEITTVEPERNTANE
ncbi:MAG: recombinase RecT [Candidatus Gastranaerophilales bacterium]|nr:recombinase RecT [Candidatus Gastranaerophilales bacterium]